ncbi:hypothetical protein [Flavobacterium sp.]|uniref:hypothetical protein n=1 Tax=Flavobacterium sp. TaxID=239 RepID=UPI0040474A79
MRESINVISAINYGKIAIYIPILLIFLGFVFGSAFLFNQKYCDGWIMAVGILGGIFFSWFYRSFAITKWRIWAFENVRNVHELKEKAILFQLIWNDNHWITKTEIRTKKDKEAFSRIARKFKKEDVLRDDISIPKETLIYHAKSFFYFGVFIIVALISITMKLVVFEKKYLALGTIPLIVFILIKLIRKYPNEEVQIKLDDSCIYIAEYGNFDWRFIENERIDLDLKIDLLDNTSTSTYFLQFDYKGHKIVKEINDLGITHIKLDQLLKVYSLRNKKKNA